MLTHWEILTAIQSNVPVNDSYAQLWGKKSQNNYTIVTYTGTLPATLIGTKAGYLHRYKIYGNTEQMGTPTPENPIVPSECGERTENLFDVSKVVTNTQVINQGRSLKVMIPSTTTGVSAAVPNTLQDYCPTLNVGDEVTLSFETTGSAKYIYLSGANISWIRGQSKTITATILSSAVIWYASGRDTEAVISNIMLNSGSTALPYEPYGYKLPLTSAGQDVDIYLGDDTLSTEEYVDSGTGKIYRMVSGVLTPVDPPIPFPQIPTAAGSTTISWAGEGLAPSQVELEYEKKR